MASPDQQSAKVISKAYPVACLPAGQGRVKGMWGGRGSGPATWQQGLGAGGGPAQWGGQQQGQGQGIGMGGAGGYMDDDIDGLGAFEDFESFDEDLDSQFGGGQVWCGWLAAGSAKYSGGALLFRLKMCLC